MAASASLEGLRVYQMSERLADTIWNMVEAWQGFPKQTLGMEMVKAADSVGASIATGFGRGTHADNVHYVSVARGALMAVKHGLRRAQARGLITETQAERLHVMTRQLPVHLNAYLKAMAVAAKAAQK